MKKLLLSLATVALGLFSANAESVTINWGSVYSVDTDLTTYTASPATITFSTGTGTSAPKYYDNGKATRIYQNNTITISLASGYELTGITFTLNGNYPLNGTTSNGTISADGTGWTPNGSVSEVTFTKGSGQFRMTEMVINYQVAGGTTEPEPGPNPPAGGESLKATFDFTSEASIAKYNSSISIPTTASQGVNVNDTPFTLDGISVTGAKGTATTECRIWCTNSGYQFRVYKGATVTISSDYTITDVTITSSQGAFTVDGNTSKTWSGSANSVVFTVTTNAYITGIDVTYLKPTDGKVSAGLAFPESTYTISLGSTFDAPTATSAAGSNGVITYTSSNEKVATVNSTTGAVEILALGSTTITAEIAETEKYTSGTAKYTLNVIPDGVISVATAIELINSGYKGVAQVKGYITSIEEVSTSYGNATYDIADEINGTPTLKAYRGKWIGGASFTSEDQIEVNGLITVEGELMNYNGTLEIGTGNTVISYEAPDNGGEDPDNPDNPEPPVGNSLVQNFTTNLGFPEGSANKPTTPTEYTATDTGITYTIMGCYANSGYLMLNGKDIEDAFISWTLETNLDELSIKTTSGCSTNVNNAVNFFAKLQGQDEFTQINEKPIQVNEQNATIAIEVPYEFRWSGTTYKIQYNKPATGNAVNSQFASFIYDISTAIESIEAEDAAPVYYNLQGVRVANPEKGLYIVVKGNKAEKVIF